LSDAPLLISTGEDVDLSNCDREPMRIPSLIQPHGALLAARDPDLRIVYASENSTEMLGLAPSALFEMTLPEALGAAAVKSIQQALAAERYFPPEINTFAIPSRQGAYFDAMSHRHGDLLCVELEPSLGSRSWDLLSMRIEQAIRELRRAKTLEELTASIPPLIYELTGYDRVMVYRYDQDGYGEVIAERKDLDMEPFLGLHYPATDIPRQAKELYLLQRIRTIVDVGYRPVQVIGHAEFTHGEPLDMTNCGLRSVSPMHIKYLQNMGVGGSFGISLIHENRLWGMVLCHHRSAKLIPPEVRTLCDFLGQLISVLIRLNLQTSNTAERLQKKLLLQGLTAAIGGHGSVVAALAEASSLLRLTGADGAFLRIGGQAHLIGKTPDLADAASLMTACRADLTEATLSSHEMGKRFPAFAHLASVASGFLFVPLKGPNDGILWFRQEITEAVRWAGKPDASKVSSDDGFRISPRKSCAAWEEVQRGRSLPWRPSEIEAALDLESISIKASADNETKEQLALEQMLREKRIEALSLMAAGLAHEINNPLAIILGRAGELLSLAESGATIPAEEVRQACESIVKTSQRAVRILRGLRGFAREGRNDPMELAHISAIAEECMGLQEARFERHGIKMRIRIDPDMPPILCREVQVGQILTNLLNNAFDAVKSSPLDLWIELAAAMREEEVFIEVTDSGRGIDDGLRAHLMEPFFTTKELGVGMGVGLSLSRAIAQDHGGTLTLLNDTPYTCFRLVLPRHPTVQHAA
jgi:chemotaxis family two-component system sensor kinase Cph1